MKIRSYLLLAVNLCFMVSMAQENLKVTLKDGSQLVGYISRQRPGEDFTLTTKMAEISLDASQVMSIIEHRIKWQNLSKEWKQWAESEGYTNSCNEDAVFTLCDIVTKDRTITQVRILERGVKVTYLELSQNNYKLSWDTISVIKSEPRSRLLLSGLNRKYVLRSGMEYKGQYIKEIPGKTLSLLQDDGTTFVFNRKDVLKDYRYPINLNQPIFEQADLLDVVRLHNGASEEGIIIERNYSDSDTITNDYLMIQQKSGTLQIKLSDIAEYQKKRNPDYNPQEDVDLNPGEVMVNRQAVKQRSVKEVAGILTCSVDSITSIVFLKDKPLELIVETKLLDNQPVSQYNLVKVISFFSKKNKKKVHGFTFESLVKDAIVMDKNECSINRITKMSFQIMTKGIYGLYDKSRDFIFIFEVK